MSTHLRTSRRRSRSPGLGARSALERSDELGRDPAAIVEPGLWLHAMLADPACTHPSWIECDVVLDPLVPGIRRSVAPGGVLRTAATGEKDAAWSYRTPDPGYERIKDYVAFYPRRMGACWVG